MARTRAPYRAAEIINDGFGSLSISARSANEAEIERERIDPSGPSCSLEEERRGNVRSGDVGDPRKRVSLSYENIAKWDIIFHAFPILPFTPQRSFPR